ncbi:YrhK family protein [Sporosarcina ureae]|uniref:YrhK family protein n=1 Tax=Sporosarcina ureae TaxID=1571 RepID=UPI0009DC5FA6|nr:YrhK family protein [Sporosarcina ureae]ARF15951.1 hypothetical protein SporoP17a_00705 [Sporosarcina ureae]
MPKLTSNHQEYEVKLGKHVIFFNKNYRYIFIINELVLGIIFIVGSVFFFFETLKTAGIILFVVGSAQLFIRPVLKILHATTLRKISQSSQSQEKVD